MEYSPLKRIATVSWTRPDDPETAMSGSTAGRLAATLGMTAHLAGQGARLGWYFGLNRGLEWRIGRSDGPPRYKPKRPVPDLRALLTDLAGLLLADAEAVRDGVYPAMPEAGDTLLEHVSRVRAMFEDVPAAADRRGSENVSSARDLADTSGLPEYFTQDFHFQTGGYLTGESARLYDVQVETLFLGSAGPMRRAVLRAVADFIAGRDQRTLALLDVACGTGRFLRQVRLAFPALRLTGLDLSRPYVTEAANQLHGLRPATWLAANAECIPLPDASQDIVTSIFLFHELPPAVRRTVAKEMARVLKPGGRLVFMDSLQMGDKPEWDGLIESFPVRFHEPYYRHYAIDDLEQLFDGAGLRSVRTEHAFLSKLMVRERV
jgi:ubiquinone/menaquinone biosynthesis C-methylase UbiE